MHHRAHEKLSELKTCHHPQLYHHHLRRTKKRNLLYPIIQTPRNRGGKCRETLVRFLQKNIKGCSFEGRKTQKKKKKKTLKFSRESWQRLSLCLLCIIQCYFGIHLYLLPTSHPIFQLKHAMCDESSPLQQSSSSLRKYCNRRIPRPTFSLLFLLLLFLLDSYWLRETAKHAGSALEDWCMIVVPYCIFLL